MKRSVCLLIVVAMIAAVCFAFAGCGDDKKKEDAKKSEATSAQAATQAAATAQNMTSAPVQQNPQTPDATQAQDAPQDSDIYGGITSVEAAEQALAFAGEGYEVVSNEQRYLRNVEAWFVGVKAFTEDSTVYYMYINSDGVTPVSEIPDRSNPQSGVYAGMTLDEAVQMVCDYLGEGWNVVGSEQRYLRNDEAWFIYASDDGGETVSHYYVVSSGVIPAGD